MTDNAEFPYSMTEWTLKQKDKKINEWLQGNG
jgi:hypothetical protein